MSQESKSDYRSQNVSITDDLDSQKIESQISNGIQQDSSISQANNSVSVVQENNEIVQEQMSPDVISQSSISAAISQNIKDDSVQDYNIASPIQNNIQMTQNNKYSQLSMTQDLQEESVDAVVHLDVKMQPPVLDKDTNDQLTRIINQQIKDTELKKYLKQKSTGQYHQMLEQVIADQNFVSQHARRIVIEDVVEIDQSNIKFYALSYQDDIIITLQQATVGQSIYLKKGIIRMNADQLKIVTSGLNLSASNWWFCSLIE
ncbi:Hypothetical_protein [Hexamita inflata]|uniref:Hypothetical_protein n=1 Tax=Hexamita inflata TaxID=28002 RepID=A0AA86TTT0_9EUKA|nr:Hypothetical protein HINF_LOCUS14342 [Hexamita inflata]